ncbi:thymidine kinase [Pseudogemmatithrix spongiicola]|uniref:Thymidine kinase n=1 Tax=Pseudogemmatithrix spongiicola TaxID=3062599 RepID=A0AA49JSV2_9BACT|nr:thymidine kinase [Gemmatimonadaceae bacterium 'strain 138']WKW14228.1 thymidine kinase [Gemmatimonadaceae bacterium 'strain 318']
MSGALQLTGGWIEVIAGVMFSGKSEELMRRVRRSTIAKKRVQVFKSHLDNRYEGGVYAVGSHDGRTLEAIPVDSSQQIALRIDPLAQVIAVDEVQFLDQGIVKLACDLALRGRRVILAGTDTDFRGEPFGPMAALMCVAEVVDKLHAICVLCGAPASRNQRLIGGKPAPYDSPVVMVGAAESYEARCRACHAVGKPDDAQLRLG